MLKRALSVGRPISMACIRGLLPLLIACNGSTDPDAVPARIEILGSGPASSNLTLGSPRFHAIAGGIQITAIAITGNSFYTHSAEAHRIASAGRPTIRAVIRAKPGKGGAGLDTVWYFEYRATLLQLPTGEYEVVLVDAYPGHPEREVARSLVQVP